MKITFNFTPARGGVGYALVRPTRVRPSLVLCCGFLVALLPSPAAHAQATTPSPPTATPPAASTSPSTQPSPSASPNPPPSPPTPSAPAAGTTPPSPPAATPPSPPPSPPDPAGPPRGPDIRLAPDEPRSAIPRPAVLRLQRESQIEVPLNQPAAAGTAIGGYGEITFNAPSNGPNVVDIRRLVLYVGHNFTDKLRFYGELEIEHAVTSSTDKGEFEVEQAFLDYLAWRPFNVRIGVILMPVGIINVYHEPPTFNGVDRPETDTRIIPSTWREPGLGFFGQYAGFRYQAYAVNGFNATGFTATNGLRDGHQEASLALGHDWGAVVRAEYVFPGLLRYGISSALGASFYYARADQGQSQFKDANGDGTIAVSLVEGDLRLHTRGAELRAEIATVWLSGSERLNRVLTMQQLMGQTVDGPVGSQLLGGYVELGYDVLHAVHLRLGTQLTPFLRYEHADTQFSLANGYSRAPGNRHDILTAGLTFRPIAEVALKFDYQHFWTDASMPAQATFDSYNAGVAFMF